MLVAGCKPSCASVAQHARSPCTSSRAPATPSYSWLRSCQPFRGVALAASRRVAVQQQAAPLTVCNVITRKKQAEEPQAVAHLRYQRGSPHKVRRILDAIRGRTYEDALMILEYSPYRACEHIQKTLLSAASNAKTNLGMSKAKLFVSECYADEGPILKRFQPRAKGRAYRILKPMCHITIKVQEAGEAQAA